MNHRSRGESIAAIPIEVSEPGNHCWRCGGQYDLRRIRMAAAQINRAGEVTMYAGYCGECRMRDHLTGQLMRGEITHNEWDAAWEAYCERASKATRS